MLLKFIQRQLLYHPRRATALKVQDFRDVTQVFQECVDVQLTCSDAVQIKGWWLRRMKASGSSPPSSPLIIFFHGNAGNRATRTNWYRLFADVGADVLAIDYHGYGDSAGRMSERGLEVSCDATWKFATEELNYDARQIVLVGTSLGGAAAVYTAANASAAGHNVCGMMLIATFSSMVDVACDLYPWLPVRQTLVDRYPSDVRISKVTCPIVVVHGTEDALVKPALGRRLFDAAPAASAAGIPKRWLAINGAVHNNILAVAAKELQAELNEMLTRIAVSSGD